MQVDKMINFGLAIGIGLIGMFVALQVLATAGSLVFPLIVTSIVGLGALGNFTFATLFTSSGVVVLIVSTVLLIGMLVLPIAGLYFALSYLKNKGGRR